MNYILNSLISGNNFPKDGRLEFLSTDHVRFQNGINVSGHNYNCNRKFIIEKNITGNEGYTVSILNMDNIHPYWGNNVQMSPKQMHIIKSSDNIIELRGFGYDPMGFSFSDYGISIVIEDEEIRQIKLNMFDRGISIIYYK